MDRTTKLAVLGMLCMIVGIASIVSGFVLITPPQTAGQTRSPAATTSPALPTPNDTLVPATQDTTVTNPYPPYTGSLVLNDPLQNNNKGYAWEEGERDQGQCVFTNGSYHSIIPLSSYFHSCLASGRTLTDFAYEVQVNPISASAGGIVFRANRLTSHFYYFTVDRNGNYLLKSFYDKNGGSTVLATGSGVSLQGNDVIGMVAKGNFISLYVNRQLIGQVNNSDNADGQVGVVVYEGEAAFSNAKVWSL